MAKSTIIKKREAKLPAWIAQLEQDSIGAPNAYLNARVEASKINFPMKFFKKYARIILICDGASEATAVSIRNSLPRVPIEVQSGYSMPYPSSEDCLAFVMAPGVGIDSENALSLLVQCHKNRTNTLAITCGGRLADYCEKLGIMYLNIPESTTDKTLQDYELIVPMVCLQMLGILSEPDPEKLRQAIEAVQLREEKKTKDLDCAAKTLLKAVSSGKCVRIITPNGLEGPALGFASFIESMLSATASVHSISPSSLSRLMQSVAGRKNDAFIIINGGLSGIAEARTLELSSIFEKQARRIDAGLVARIDLGSGSELHLENVLKAKAALDAVAVSAIKQALHHSTMKKIPSKKSRWSVEKYNENSRLLQLLDEQVMASARTHEDGELSAKQSATGMREPQPDVSVKTGQQP